MKSASRYPRATLLAGALVVTAPSALAAAEGLNTLVAEGEASLDLRYRFESVEQDNARRDADASTLRTRLTLATAEVFGFSAVLEVDDVMTIGSDDYDSLMVGDKHFGTHSVVADPVGTEVNQAWAQYAFSESVAARAGRQRILHGGQRFVGGVGWRQNEQTYDALTLNVVDGDLTLDYSYVWNVNRIFDGSGTSVQPPEFDSESHFLRATAALGGGTLNGFVYALDFDEAPALSSITYGLGYSASLKAFSYDLTAATQSDYGDNTASYDALYLAAE